MLAFDASKSISVDIFSCDFDTFLFGTRKHVSKLLEEGIEQGIVKDLKGIPTGFVKV